MPKLILDVGAGFQTADVRATALSDTAVSDAVETTQANVVIATVDQVTPEVRRRLARLPGVDAVYDDLQAVPLVQDEKEVQDFLDRVRDRRGDDDVPPTRETKPVRADGGAVIQPAPPQFGLSARPTGTIAGATDSIDLAGARQLHEQGVTGESVIAVIVDTGLCASAFAADRRLEGVDLTDEDDPWTPLHPHGGMTGGIMAGDENTPGVDTGFLPGADVFPIKSTFAASELIQAQDIIVDLSQRDDRTVVVNNSWGIQECAGVCGHPVTQTIDSVASTDGIIQVFAAGNIAEQCGRDCAGSTVGISGPNSLSSVITVAASGKDGESAQLQDYSSRGGPADVACGERKPDLAAPIYGTIPWGCGQKDIGNGGGTSGACPQVAGAVGLVADAIGNPSTERVLAGLEATAEQFRGEGFNGCSGRGNVRTAGAAEAVPPSISAAGLGDTATVAGIGLTIGLVGAALRQRTTRI